MAPTLAHQKQTPNPETLGKTKPNPAYISWVRLAACPTKSVHTKVIGLSTSQDVWIALEKHFSSKSRARLLQLKLQLQTIKKGALLICEYLQKIKVFTDHLTTTGHIVPDEEIMLYILGGLGPDYDALVTPSPPAVNQQISMSSMASFSAMNCALITRMCINLKLHNR